MEDLMLAAAIILGVVTLLIFFIFIIDVLTSYGLWRENVIDKNEGIYEHLIKEGLDPLDGDYQSIHIKEWWAYCKREGELFFQTPYQREAKRRRAVIKKSIQRRREP